MLRHGLTFTILALTGALLTVPDPTFARPSFRPAFTGGPFRIVIPSGRIHGGLHGAVRGMPRRALGHPLVSPKPASPVQAALPRESGRPFRGVRYRRIGSYVYPVTVGADWSYYGMTYDPSDAITIYGPLAVAQSQAQAQAQAAEAPVKQSHGCRAESVVVPSASGSGEGEITIVRC